MSADPRETARPTLIDRLADFERHQLEAGDAYGAEVLARARDEIVRLTDERDRERAMTKGVISGLTDERDADREALAFMYRSASPDDPTGVRNAARIKGAERERDAAEANAARWKARTHRRDERLAEVRAEADALAREVRAARDFDDSDALTARGSGRRLAASRCWKEVRQANEARGIPGATPEPRDA